MKGVKGIGSHKHGTSGRSPKSPRFRHNQKLELERASIKGKSMADPKESVKALFDRKNLWSGSDPAPTSKGRR